MSASFVSRNPATGEPVWSGRESDSSEVDAAVAHARGAFAAWSRRPLTERIEMLRAFERELQVRREALVDAICREVGKPRWEALTEVQSMAGKVQLSIDAQARRTAEFRGGAAIARFRPHGVVAVLGPFNFPGHLPNGHIVPALLAGNTVVFKPSELAPLVAERTVEIWKAAGLPEHVLNLVQGGRPTGAALAEHPGINGLFFTGSARAGLWLAEKFAATPERVLALEMGGNNPLVVWDAHDARTAALLVAQSAFVTAGQRCTCARRLIVQAGKKGDEVIAALASAARNLRVGAYTETPEPFMGPVISPAAAAGVLAMQDQLLQDGAIPILPSAPLRAPGAFVSPGIVDVTPMSKRHHEEIFGPLLQVVRVRDFQTAIEEANRTPYGLAAGLIGGDDAQYTVFRDSVKAGIVNWNQPLTGASGAVPFGGVGQSGNHRPSGFFAADYCSYPVASIEVPELKPPPPLPGLSAP